jgi:hypothetical protein
VICHSLRALPLPAGALPVAMVPPDFPVLLIPPIAFEPLPTTLPPPASLAAIGMSAIAGPADQEHRAAPVGAAKQLSKWNFRDACSRAGVDNGKLSWQARRPCRVAGSSSGAPP